MDALDDDDVVRLQIFARHVCAAMVRIIVALFGNAPAFQQILHIFQQLIVIKDRRFVIVEQTALLKAQIRMILIIGVLIDNQDAFVDHRCQLLGQRGLSAAARAADSDKKHGYSLSFFCCKDIRLPPETGRPRQPPTVRKAFEAPAVLFDRRAERPRIFAHRCTETDRPSAPQARRFPLP